MQLFISDDFVKTNNEIIISEKRIVDQLRKVLRAKAGYVFLLQNKTGNIQRYKLEVENISNTITAKIKNIQKNNNKPKNKGIIQAILNKVSKMELIVQKLTEIGVPKIYFIGTNRSVFKDIKDNKLERFEKIALEAAEQSLSWYMPDIKVIKNFDEVSGNKAVLNFDGKDFKKINFNNIDFLVIGPEGGFDDKDIENMQAKQDIYLGQKILRSETASIIGGFILMS